MFRHAMARWIWPVLLMTAMVCAAVRPAAAQETLGETTSLGQAPEDVAFYSANFNGRKVYDAIMSSNAVQRVLELPSTQEALTEMHRELEREGFFEFLADSENQQLLTLLADMGSHEIYICGDEGLADALDLYTECTLEYVKVNFELMFEGQYGRGDSVVIKASLDVLERRNDDLKLPNIVLGFKLTEETAAEEQLARLEQLLHMLIAQMAERHDDMPDFESALERVTVGDSEFLTFRIDGEMVPWEQLDWELEQIGSSIDDYEDLIEDLKEREYLISLGVRDGYALLVLGPDHEFLENLGQGPALWERPEMQPLREAELTPEEIFAVSYVSDSMAGRLDSARRTINMYLDMAETIVDIEGRGDPAAAEFVDDLPELRRDLMSLLPERHAMMGYSYFTDRGVEGYLYNRSTNLMVDASQTLPILDHGGDPLLMIAGRQPFSTRIYELGVKWAVKGYGYWEIEMKMWAGPEEIRMLERVRESAAPLLKELDNIVTTMLLPSMADGQQALVLDGDMTSETWSRWMDPSEEPLPMVEVGMVIGLSDAEMLIEACTSSREVINELIEEVRDATGGEMPEEIFLPAPETTEVEGGVMYSYPWQELEFHEEINPNAIISDDWLVLSLSPEHGQRLLAESPLPETPPLARRDQPLAGALYVNVAGAVDAIEPWVEYFVAGGDMMGQFEYGPVEWEEDFAVPAEEWDGGEGEDPFEEDPFGEEGAEEAEEEDLFEEDPFDEEAEAPEVEPEFDGDPFGGEDPFEDREAHEFENDYDVHGPYGYEEEHYRRRGRQWAPGEAEATSRAVLNLFRSVRTLSAVMYEEDEVMVTHFEWHIADAGDPASDPGADDSEENNSEEESGGEE